MRAGLAVHLEIDACGTSTARALRGWGQETEVAAASVVHHAGGLDCRGKESRIQGKTVISISFPMRWIPYITHFKCGAMC